VATAGKHAPKRLDRYLAIHAAVMGHRQDEGFVLEDGLMLDRVPVGYRMSGSILCAGGLRVEVRKVLRIVSGEAATAMVQTVDYTYHATLDGFGNLLRYCSPHDDDAHPEHKPYHHKHSYDVLGGDVVGSIEAIAEDDWPTLGEVLAELRDWYSTHAERIEALRSRG